MSEEDNLFLAAVGQLPREEYPATCSINAVFQRLDLLVLVKLPPHLHPLFVRLRAFCVRRTFTLEKRLHLNPAFKLLLSIRVVPPELAFVAAAATTLFALRYLYKHALDLLTNIIGVAYPAYQSILAIEYGGLVQEPVVDTGSKGSSLDSALGISEPNLDKKQWLMYWAIYGVLTTADHWAGPILRLFPMYRVAKIGVLVWAQHRRYNGATWLYDTFVRPLLPPAVQYQQQQPQKRKQQSPAASTATYDPRPYIHVNSKYHEAPASTATQQEHEGRDAVHASDEAGSRDSSHDPAHNGRPPSTAFSSLVMPSVWDSANAQAAVATK